MVVMVAEGLILMKGQKEPEVKKNALDGLTTLVHGDWRAVADLVADIEAFAHQELPIRPELIEEVDLGPFKQKRDHGVPMRKAAYALLE